MDIEDEYDKIFRFCYWKVRDQALAEDLTQETFLRWLDSGYQENGKRIRYLYTIARNLCIDERRKSQPVDLPEELPDPKGENDSIDKVFLEQMIEQLAEEELELLVMRYVNQDSIGTICEITGESRFALFRKLQKIRKKIASIGENQYRDN
ncbi:MAG: RNA polymerase sigma factor [Anaerolineaceae bacterium]|nr:RNA polymerase sigma factor [Anaerolineaceae bacterium]